MRLVRQGAVFTGYSSTNYGVWDLIGSFDTSVGTEQYPDTIMVGLATSSGNAGATTSARYSDFGPAFVVPPAPILTIALAGADVEVSWQDASKGYTLKNASSVLGPWNVVPNSSTTNRVFVPRTIDTMFFRAVWE